MATSVYMNQRKRYQRPQSILWSENAGTLTNGLYVPIGYEVGGTYPENASSDLIDQFLVLSDHNRGDMQFSPQRIEQRQRTINGRMRSYHIADKLQINVSWTNLPSRSYNKNPDFSYESAGADTIATEYTTDGGAGGGELLDWYENHKGPFWMFLGYDKYKNFSGSEDPYSHLKQYNQIVQVYFSDFNYSVVKRGGNNHDLWNVSVSLEEV
jgi:hypothetical protein